MTPKIDINALQSTLENEKRDYWNSVSRSSAINTEIRKRKRQDEVEAILANYLNDPTNEEYMAEFKEFQIIRQECKDYVDAMITQYKK